MFAQVYCFLSSFKITTKENCFWYKATAKRYFKTEINYNHNDQISVK